MGEVKWIRVGIEVDPEAAEPIAELFSRYADGGVVLEERKDKRERRVSHQVSAYLSNDGELPYKQEMIEQGLASLRLIQPLPEAVYEPIQEQNWMESWKERYEPLKIGARFLIQPAWIEAAKTERIILRIDPGMAFGTGVHPTTQLALGFLETLVQSDSQVLDLGSGSGILSFGAEKLGAISVQAVEVDGEAIGNAQHNAELNGSALTFTVGSIAEARELAPEGGYDLVVANIIATILLRLMDEGLCELVAEEGKLLLSGILEEQAEAMHAALAERSFEVVEQRQSGDWIALVARRKSAE